MFGHIRKPERRRNTEEVRKGKKQEIALVMNAAGCVRAREGHTRKEKERKMLSLDVRVVARRGSVKQRACQFEKTMPRHFHRCL